ncbi:platelet endothelial aggregation receptor 1, partial [Biomphalaria glabrata]
QNVAIKQNVYYSILYENHINTNLPRYPQATDGLQTCNKSDTGIVGIKWKLVMSPSFVIKNYFFYVNDTVGGYRNIDIKTLDTFDNYGQMSRSFLLIGERSGTSYSFMYESTEPTTELIFSMTSTSTNKSMLVLLCEVEALTECKEGSWGVHCKNKCNESCPKMCRFDDGICNNACLGFSNPPQCTKACSVGLFGINCSSRCSEQCLNQTCDAITGHCIQCREGFQGLFCEQ